MNKEVIIDIENPKDNDLISRQVLLKLMGEEPFNWTDSDKELQEVEDYRNFRNIIEQLPSVRPQESSRDMEEIKEIINCDADAETKCKMISNILTAKPHYFEEQEPKIGYCKDCKHFRKLPYHADKLGKCVQHWGFCPPSDWYCADFVPRESEG